jgi:mannose-6-phosphate isomerase
MAESWEVSDLDGASTGIRGGEYAGTSLRELVGRYPAELLGEAGVPDGAGITRFPLLVKYLDAAHLLSVQVHPGDEFARKNENGASGKTEMWYIVEARPDAEVISGLAEGTTPQMLREAILDGTVEHLVRRYRVSQGDVVSIPAGRVHALGAGIVALEIQQTSDVTYRMYDWGRRGVDGLPRQLHIEQSLAVTDFADHDTPCVTPVRRHCKWGTRSLLCLTQYFLTESLEMHGSVELTTTGSSADVLAVVSGDVGITWGAGNTRLTRGETVILPAQFGRYVCSAQSEAFLVRSHVPAKNDLLGDWAPSNFTEQSLIRGVCDSSARRLI